MLSGDAVRHVPSIVRRASDLMSTTHFLPEFGLQAPVKWATEPTPGELVFNPAIGSSYRIGRKIGWGYFSVVYSCRDAANAELAAKVFKPTGTYEKVRASALAEFQKLLLLRHPYITRVVDTFECRNTFYVITERCNCSLEELFSRRPFLGPRLFMPVATCVLQAMDYIHANGYVHQDAHMGNVLATFLGDTAVFGGQGAMAFKLSDLGTAKFVNELDCRNTRADGMLVPEVIDPQEFGPIDQRIDVYHVALLLLQLSYSRKFRFSHDEIIAGRPREMATRLQPPYGSALERALRRHVASRTASANELLQELQSP
jgi:eukaryotic-like serine/threonine-protein kinase